MARVVVAMSGGVDSSVAAWLLREAGHEVVGIFMRHGYQPAAQCDAADSNSTASLSPSALRAVRGRTDSLQLPVVSPTASHKQGCCTASDAADARRVADRLGVPFYALNMDADFGRIMDYFVDEYRSGRTPNPCVMCNNWLKFGKLLEYADGIGAEYVASGHYARLSPAGSDGEVRLLRGMDASKDQSYVLFGIERALLPRILFPVGEYTKPQIRAMARTIGLKVADKHDSQEICFVPDRDYARFVRAYVAERESATAGVGEICGDVANEAGSAVGSAHDPLDLSGELVTTAGDVVGQHPGIEHFTIGQRKGLGIAFGEPRYVVRIERATRRVVIGEKHELAQTHLSANRVNWLVDRPREKFDCTVQIRYTAKPVPALVTPLADDRLDVLFDDPQHGVAPGQAVVCYAGDRVIAGGWIE